MAIKKIITSALSTLFSYAANLEFILFIDNGIDVDICRRLYLRMMRVQFKSFRIGKEFYLKNRSSLKLGDNARIGSFTKIWNYSPVMIGENFLAAGNLTLNTGTHDIYTYESASAPITIGNNVWCGINVTILSGVSIGDNCVIGAGAVVTTDIPNNAVAAGVPAKIIKIKNASSSIKK